MNSADPPSIDKKLWLLAWVKSKHLEQVWPRLCFSSLGVSVCWLGNHLLGAARALVDMSVLSWEEIQFRWNWKITVASGWKEGTVHISPVSKSGPVALGAPLCLSSAHPWLWGENSVSSLPDLATPGLSRECLNVDGSFSQSSWAHPGEETTFRTMLMTFDVSLGSEIKLMKLQNKIFLRNILTCLIS